MSSESNESNVCHCVSLICQFGRCQNSPVRSSNWDHAGALIVTPMAVESHWDLSMAWFFFHGCSWFFMVVHVGTLYGQKTEGSATRWSPERVTGVTIRSHNPIFAAIHCTKLRYDWAEAQHGNRTKKSQNINNKFHVCPWPIPKEKDKAGRQKTKTCSTGSWDRRKLPFRLVTGTHGFSWLFMVFHGFSWLFMVFMVVHCFSRFFMLFHCFSWCFMVFFMVFHGFSKCLQSRLVHLVLLGFHGLTRTQTVWPFRRQNMTK